MSVSIAAYNVESTLREALNPFVQCLQRDKLDIIIVDDASKDSTPAIAQEYVDKYPETFRLITKENGGWGSTLNVGFKEARGKYFKQLDGDDYFSKENLDDFITFLEQYDADMIYAPFIQFDNQTGGILRLLGSYSCFPNGKIIYLDELENFGFAPAMHDLAIRTKVLQDNKIHITEHCFYTDVEYVLKTYNFCYTMLYYDKPIYYYRIARDGQSMSLSGVRKHYLEHQLMMFTMLQYFNTEVKRESVKKIFLSRLEGVCNMQYVFYMAVPSTPENKKAFRDFDRQLKNGWPKIYEKVDMPSVAFLRNHNFFGYSFISRYKMYKDRKLKRNIFER